ncbi:MAG: flavodoxin family protein [Candidatus Freyarchaeota archaeon]
MRSLVVYYSETGNTEKVAKSIAKGLNAAVKRIEEVGGVADYDLICVGTPVHYLGPAKPVRRFLDGLPRSPGKKGAAFCTYHNIGDSRTIQFIKQKMEEKGFTFLGGFSCKGESSIVANLGPRIFNKGRPNKEDLQRAENFGRSLHAEDE